MILKVALSPLLLAGALLLLPLAALAETPNINPGLWEYTHTMTIEGGPQMPPQVHKNQECITQADLQEAYKVVEVPEGCTLENLNMHAGGAEYTMSCIDETGTTMSMQAEMQFMGDRSLAILYSSMETPDRKSVV